jgi:hypothetical protein
MKKRILTPLTAALTVLGISVAIHAPAMAANDYEQQVRSVVVPKVQAWLADTAVVAAVSAQNQSHSGLTQSQVDKMDKEWRSETSAGGGALISAVLGNELSKYLAGVKNDGRGIYTEIFVMDNKGLNVGQSDVTSDYWQGDEDKWKKTYLVGPDAVFIDEVEFDESTQTFQSQLSLPVVDPATGETVGAVTVGVNVDMLQ